MPASIRILDDAFNVVTSLNFGAIAASASQSKKIYIENNGTTSASSVRINLHRVASNDGVDYSKFAQDDSGNPGTYQTGEISLGTVTAGQRVPLWVKATTPAGVSPQGNPRQFDVTADYIGT